VVTSSSSARDGDEAVVKAQRRAAKVIEVVAGAKAADDAMSDVSASTAAAGRVMVLSWLKGSYLWLLMHATAQKNC
jgi:hypothetical protein